MLGQYSKNLQFNRTQKGFRRPKPQSDLKNPVRAQLCGRRFSHYLLRSFTSGMPSLAREILLPCWCRPRGDADCLLSSRPKEEDNACRDSEAILSIAGVVDSFGEGPISFSESESEVTMNSKPYTATYGGAKVGAATSVVVRREM